MKSRNNILTDIWKSFRAMPAWVQIWVMFLLVPINIASLFFLGESFGKLVAFFANFGLIMNIPIMLRDRGFSKMMAIPHLFPWTNLVLFLLFARPDAAGAYDVYLWVLLATNSFSLLFDYPDALKWWRGDRAIAS